MGRGDQTREHILGAALSQATKLGLEGLTIGRLARELEMSKSGLFAHFGSKTGLQLAVLARARDIFIERVLRPALRQPRGEARVRALFENWLVWTRRAELEGGCLFAATASEFDDRPGPVRDEVASALERLRETLRRCAELAVEEGDFRADLDLDQFAFEWHGIQLAHHMESRLFRHPHAAVRARRAFDRLLDHARP